VKSILVIGLKEFRDRLRSGWVAACMLAWVGVISLTSLFGLIQMGRIGVQGYERTTASLLNLAQYLVPLLALLAGHDLIVREREDRTLHLILGSGVARWRLLLGKFLGGIFTIAVPLVTGFLIAGALIGTAAHDATFAPFLRLAASTIALGIVFAGIGLLASTFARSRVQALVCALLAWGVAVFAFDLAALGVIVSTRAVPASHELDLICDATHVNAQADLHASFDEPAAAVKQPASRPAAFRWLWINPVDVFRAVNLPGGLSAFVSPAAALGWLGAWVAFSLGAALWRFERMDL
jgi:Cu-processing system permease protein